MKKGSIIFGHPRSGTTLLRRLLNSHSQIASPPETHLFSSCARFIESDATADGIEMGVLSGLHFAGIESATVLKDLRTFAFGYLESFTKSQGKKRWVEKTAFDIYKLKLIEELCADQVFYLGIIRHPFDVALSSKEFCDAAGVYPKEMHKYVQKYPQVIEAFIHSWIDTTNSLIELGERRPEHTLICRYEDLISEPEETLSDILSFIDESIEPGMIVRTFDDLSVLGFSDHKSYQVNRIHKNSVNKWGGLPKNQIKRLAVEVNPLLEKCGYDLLENNTVDSLQESRRRYLNSLLIHAGNQQIK